MPIIVAVVIALGLALWYFGARERVPKKKGIGKTTEEMEERFPITEKALAEKAEAERLREIGEFPIEFGKVGYGLARSTYIDFPVPHQVHSLLQQKRITRETAEKMTLAYIVWVSTPKEQRTAPYELYPYNEILPPAEVQRRDARRAALEEKLKDLPFTPGGRG